MLSLRDQLTQKWEITGQGCKQKQETLHACIQKLKSASIYRYFKILQITLQNFCFGFSICNLKFDLLISVSPSDAAVLG